MSGGAGSQPAGVTPASGFITQPAVRSSVVYPKPSTGEPQSGRLLDPKTRSFASTDDGRFAGMSSVEQCVLIAWSTFDYSSIGPLDAGYPNRARDAYLGAVRFLLDSRLMEVVDFQMKRFGSSGLRVVIRWRDLTTNVSNVFESPTP